ncbi:hypothetical protein AOQ84DRAFT_378368 [Glonium stellatum]|uniref:Cytochrome P450 n=1 Tax=Glonium stellatum TaxID=574774 RepID=A0A8E2JRF7_9PEZI|nr:hypothetical protein AOQ84DRAFT_378368 [Glonium stellatum]
MKLPLKSLFGLADKYEREDYRFSRFSTRERTKKFFSDIEVMRKTANEILQECKAEKNLDMRKDLLPRLLNGVGPKTGQKMTEQSTLNNLITLLVADHETTSGILS